MSKNYYGRLLEIPKIEQFFGSYNLYVMREIFMFGYTTLFTSLFVYNETRIVNGEIRIDHTDNVIAIGCIILI